LIRRRLAFAVEFSQSFFARRHFRPSPSVALAFYTRPYRFEPDARDKTSTRE
jgi:hypothetical protein